MWRTSLLLLACAREVPEPDSGAPPSPEDATLQFENANNYTFEGVLNAPRIPLAALTDATVEWSGLDADLQCHDLDPIADVDNVGLMVFPYLTADEVEEGLAIDSLQQVDMGLYLSHEPGEATQVTLSQLTFFGTAADIQTEFQAGSGTWLVLLSTGTGVGVGSRMMAFIEPEVDGPTTATITDGCSVLDYTVELEALTPLDVPLDGPWIVDWGGVTATGHGSPLLPTRVTSLKVARYDSLSLPDLEARFLDLDSLASQTWSVAHPSGTTDDLAAMTSAVDGAPFPGFDADGTWLLALMCDSCPVPAPLALTVLRPLAPR
jgi:hypothetical protein